MVQSTFSSCLFKSSLPCRTRSRSNLKLMTKGSTETEQDRCVSLHFSACIQISVFGPLLSHSLVQISELKSLTGLCRSLRNLDCKLKEK